MSAVQLGDKYAGGIYAGTSSDETHELIVSSRIICNAPKSWLEAANLCKSYVGPDGSNDWELPTAEDFGRINANTHKAKISIKRVITCNDDKVFWSSTTLDSNNREGFGLEVFGKTASTRIYHKRNLFYVKAIRRIPIKPAVLDIDVLISNAVTLATAEKDRTIKQLADMILEMKRVNKSCSSKMNKVADQLSIFDVE